MTRTPDYRIKAALRKLWLWSGERNEAIKRDQSTCQICGVKGSRAKDNIVKVEVHHKEGILNWDEIYKAIRKNLLCDPEHLETLCKECHKSHG